MTEQRSTFRYTVGLIAVIGGLGGLACLYFVEVPTGNIEPLLIALGIVLGWGSSVINGEWGSSPAGRKAAEVGVEAGRKAAESPAGTPGDPMSIEGTPQGEAVTTKPKGKGR